MSAPAVLVVGVGVDDDVGAELEAGVEPGLEPRGEALVVGQADDVLDPVFAGHLDRAVGRAVVDHQQLDRVDSRRISRGMSAIVAGSVCSSFEAGDLDDQLHDDGQGIRAIGPIAVGARVLSQGEGALRAVHGLSSTPLTLCHPREERSPGTLTTSPALPRACDVLRGALNPGE